MNTDLTRPQWQFSFPGSGDGLDRRDILAYEREVARRAECNALEAEAAAGAGPEARAKAAERAELRNKGEVE